MKLPTPAELVVSAEVPWLSPEFGVRSIYRMGARKMAEAIRDALREKESALDPYDDRHVIEALDDAIDSIDEMLNGDNVKMKGR